MTIGANNVGVEVVEGNGFWTPGRGTHKSEEEGPCTLHTITVSNGSPRTQIGQRAAGEMT